MTTDAHTHHEYMLEALAQAKLALDAGNLPIGAVIVHEGRIIAAGHNRIDTPANDTQHAELTAIQSIAPFLAEHKHQCTIYTTLEPCMMCLGAIINVGIDNIVVGVADRLVGAIGLLPHGEYYQYKLNNMHVVREILEKESQALLNEYVRNKGVRQHLAIEIE
ncbi:nucleoside deaminase [Deefgea rivuli]|uniref:nucleoside deaminase n=1 Tax=Deefgea rivuli TaxID=400948 RepID=UPI00048212D8|nr:nucleoside deaminase [Deefgea rivuli]